MILESALEGHWFYRTLNCASFLICQKVHYIQLLSSNRNKGVLTNKVTEWHIRILYNQGLTWIKISSFANDFVPSGRANLFPQRLFRICVALSITTKVASTHLWGQRYNTVTLSDEMITKTIPSWYLTYKNMNEFSHKKPSFDFTKDAVNNTSILPKSQLSS